MTSSKYLALFESGRPFTSQESSTLVEEATRRWQMAGSETPGVTGLVLAAMAEPVSPGPDVAFVAQWWSDEDPGAVIDSLSGAADGLTPFAWLVREHVYRRPVERLSAGSSPGRVNLFGTARRREEFTTESFFAYWDDVHAPISSAVPGLGGYVASEVLETVTGDRVVDGFVELWWPDRDTFTASADTPQQAAAWADVGNYARTDGSFWITHEHVVVAPPDTGPGSQDAHVA